MTAPFEYTPQQAADFARDLGLWCLPVHVIKAAVSGSLKAGYDPESGIVFYCEDIVAYVAAEKDRIRRSRDARRQARAERRAASSS